MIPEVDNHLAVAFTHKYKGPTKRAAWSEFVRSECVNLFETIFRKKFYAAMGSGGLMNTIGLSAGGSGVPCTKRLGLRAYAA